MAFTNDDLKQLKGFIQTIPLGTFEFGKIECASLLVRLEYAELAVKTAREISQGINGISWKYFKVIYDAWLKSTGKLTEEKDT